jgi:hypothetical protein
LERDLAILDVKEFVEAFARKFQNRLGRPRPLASAAARRRSNGEGMKFPLANERLVLGLCGLYPEYSVAA